jgi:PAS domain S-box-containing protein
MTSSDDVPRTDGVTMLAGRPGDELTRRILDVAHDAFVGMDDAGRIVAWNASAERIFGRSAADVAGADLAETIIPTRFHAAHREGLRRFLATGEGTGDRSAHRAGRAPCRRRRVSRSS